MSESAQYRDAEMMFEMMALLQKGQRPPSTISDNIMKIAVTICTAGILWLVTSVSALQNQMTEITVKHSVTEKALERLDLFTQKPRFTADDFRSNLAPVKQKVERHSEQLSARQTWMDSTNHRLAILEGNHAMVMEKLNQIARHMKLND